MIEWINTMHIILLCTQHHNDSLQSTKWIKVQSLMSITHTYLRFVLECFNSLAATKLANAKEGCPL